MNKFIKSLLITAIALSITSCIYEELPTLDPEEVGEAVLVLNIEAADMYSSSETRAAFTHEQENTFEDLYVLIFDATNKIVGLRKGIRDTYDGTQYPNYSQTGTFKVTLTESAKDEPAHRYRLVVLANAEKILMATIGTVFPLDLVPPLNNTIVDGSYASVTRALNEAISGKMLTDNTKGIPMWGEITEGTHITVRYDMPPQTVKLTRAVARVDVGVGNVTRSGAPDYKWTWDGMQPNGTTPIPFELTEVIIIRANNAYSLIPANSSTPAAYPLKTENGGNAFPLTFPPLPITGLFPTAMTKFPADATNADLFKYNAVAKAGTAASHITREIYVPEADIVMQGIVSDAGKGAGVGIPFDQNHLHRMAVIVGGKYMGAANPTYYRLDFTKTVEEPAGSGKYADKLIDVYRNHLYQFNIASVTGPGRESPEVAYQNRPENMIVNVVEWNMEEMGQIYLDGPKYIKVMRDLNENLDPRHAVVYRKEGSQDEVPFITNINLSEFSLEWIDGQSDYTAKPFTPPTGTAPFCTDYSAGVVAGVMEGHSGFDENFLTDYLDSLPFSDPQNAKYDPTDDRYNAMLDSSHPDYNPMFDPTSGSGIYDPTYFTEPLFRVEIVITQYCKDTNGEETFTGYFRFTALKDYDAVAVGIGNPSTVRVTRSVNNTKRFTFGIDVEQWDSDPKDWRQGDKIEGELIF